MSTSSLPYPGYHWVFPHHGTKFNVETVLKVIELFKKHEGESMRSTKGQARIEVNEGLSLLLSSNSRGDMKGRKEPFRDYQQLFTHLGILYPHELMNGKLTLTPFAKQLANGHIDYPAFLFLQTFGYQYPNGASKKQNIYEMYREHTILVKPFLLIYQILIELGQRSKDATQAYLYRDEISRFLVPQRGHSQVDEIVSAILDGRKLHFGDITQLHRRSSKGKKGKDNKIESLTRTVSEFIEILEFLPFFEVYPHERRKSNKRVSLYTPEIERVGLSEVQVLVEVEADKQNFHLFRGNTKADRLAWFEYYGGVGRKERWDQRVEQLEELFFPPPPVHLREMHSVNIPSTIAPAQVQSTLEQTALLQQQRLEAHQKVVQQLAQRFQAVGITVTCDLQSIDVQASIDAQSYFFEVKSLAGDQSDVVEQTREAVGQLYEYQYRAGVGSADDIIRLCVVLDRFPVEHQWILLYLINHLHILVCWWDESARQFRFPEASPTEKLLKDILCVSDV